MCVSRGSAWRRSDARRALGSPQAPTNTDQEPRGTRGTHLPYPFQSSSWQILPVLWLTAPPAVTSPPSPAPLSLLADPTGPVHHSVNLALPDETLELQKQQRKEAEGMP